MKLKDSTKALLGSLVLVLLVAGFDSGGVLFGGSVLNIVWRILIIVLVLILLIVTDGHVSMAKKLELQKGFAKAKVIFSQIVIGIIVIAIVWIGLASQ